MTCCIAQFRARVGMFYTRALRLSTLKLSFVTAGNVYPVLLLVMYGPLALTFSLFLFIFLDCTPPSVLAYTQSLCCHSSVNSANPVTNSVPSKFISLLINLAVMLFIHLLLQLAGDIHPNPGANDIDLNGLSY